MAQQTVENIDIAAATKRFNFNLSPRAASELRRLSQESGLSMTEILRIALGLVKIAMDEEAKGHKLLITDSDQRPLREIIIPR